ncbi:MULTISPECIES: response regulator [Pseudomonas]|jgi:two-component system, OmpR family, response regulator VicR|uniref:response regulator n=1 Tax=Pseudomonas TaxID=286 RepID=UPI000E6BD1D2|nr:MULTISPECIES: response regulator [unclassified Pseudomonas]QJI11279.1 response regulator [Pseudomonas sp. ADAK22]
MTTILVVDDEYLIADILSFALEDEGFMVVTASNGRKALEVLDRERPALIITDFMMPVMDGQEFATAVRALPAGSHLPIILMSGAQAHIGMQRSDLFDVVLPKPFDIDLIIAEVRKLLSSDQSVVL